MQVVLLTFGENFPDANEAWLFQVYSIAMGLLGVVGFALLLALTEQIILEVLESNVRQGTKVFERDHVLVLAQCVGGKDMETLWRMLNQVRLACSVSGTQASHPRKCYAEQVLPRTLTRPGPLAVSCHFWLAPAACVAAVHAALLCKHPVRACRLFGRTRLLVAKPWWCSQAARRSPWRRCSAMPSLTPKARS